MVSQPNDELAERVRATTVKAHVLLADTTELYLDLDIYGGDLFELLTWVRARFGVDFSTMNLDEYAPSDGVNLLALFGTKPTYKSLTLGALREAIVRGRWIES